ncbi:unnamed protein product [Tetraodon nigroviridis]|uniref:(spotted green pufferfish) hypothetical protein n=1 Tax=Tetraodon nigroviridis TaxID=99883 RepID=Q4S5C0_TETNG|nr:unnamed protein product [Tetraodon nigroviridis]
MKVHPEEPRPPCIQASKPRPPPLFQGKMSDALTLAAPKMQTLQADAGVSGSERSTFSPLQPCPLMGSPLVPRPPPGSASANIPPANSGHLTPFPVFPPSSKPFGPGSPENLPAEASAGPVSGPFSDSDPCLATLAFPSTTWSSCPSPERTTPRSGSGAGLSPSASAAGPDPHRWPLLPPISPVKGCGASASSRSSELSCSQSHMFDELEAIAPPSPSCRSSDSPRSASAHTAAPRDVFHPAELSPGLAALTVGCRSGHLSSISRVQLLLLDRAEPADEELSPLQDCFGLGLRDEAAPTFSGPVWLALLVDHTPESVMRHIQERCMFPLWFWSRKILDSGPLIGTCQG